MERQYRVLVADDDESILSTLRLLLKVNQYEVSVAARPLEVIQQIEKTDPDIALIDLNYELDTTSGREGLALLENIRQLAPDMPVVVMTGWGTIDLAVAAMKAGAADFIQKPWDNTRLLHTLQTQIQLAEGRQKQNRLQQQNSLLLQELNPCEDNRIVAESHGMKQLLEMITQVASSDASILLTGENGTGKSMLANFIHQHSERREESFVSVNMGCITDTLFESEMFGHVKGAFTDARQNRIGRFELADRGTLFLDEIANTPINQQAKLLRVLEEKQMEKVGASKTQSVDVRIIAATNADLNEVIEQGGFRRDLYYRLNTFEFRVPALRERVEDIGPLSKRLLDDLALKYRKNALTIEAEGLDLLQRYTWPGNVRELSHVLERALLLSRSDRLDGALVKQVLPGIAEFADHPAASSAPLSVNHNVHQTLEDLEQNILQQRLTHFDGNASQAADSLGLSRSAFYRRLGKGQHKDD
ncbi:sigma-54-dependent Fis family transcriptional regulator [Hahella sp. CCB-MM4]|uniref:sigma-54-dependent transcriptional regulator n=1 Tax=Hahella sp. (strain CCB-MM4) TaxID=1926491 RepID=UPI000B9A5837|nr:sigma-54 dependent transcriptional regulator [Hahella sp. CCB-MM4]OZG71823.1 sigma-54-dependent Fis family transcriptional regulator [Hahella sp. CCB-MM4]